MGLLHGFHAPAGRTGCSDVDRGAAELFVRAQSSWLSRGLTRARDPVAARLVLTVHDRAHESWLALIAAANRELPPDAATRLAALYTFHGHVAGVLEQFVDRWNLAVPQDVCEDLQERLEELTESAVDALAAPAIARTR